MPIMDVLDQLQSKFADQRLPGNTNYEDLCRYLHQAKAQYEAQVKETRSMEELEQHGPLEGSKRKHHHQRRQDSEFTPSRYVRPKRYTGDATTTRSTSFQIVRLHHPVRQPPGRGADSRVGEDVAELPQVRPQQVQSYLGGERPVRKRPGLEATRQAGRKQGEFGN